MLTRQHYIRIAEILGRNNADEKLVIDLAKYFREDNPAFKHGKFSLAVEEERYHQRLAEEAKFLTLTAPTH